MILFVLFLIKGGQLWIVFSCKLTFLICWAQTQLLLKQQASPLNVVVLTFRLFVDEQPIASQAVVRLWLTNWSWSGSCCSESNSMSLVDHKSAKRPMRSIDREIARSMDWATKMCTSRLTWCAACRKSIRPNRFRRPTLQSHSFVHFRCPTQFPFEKNERSQRRKIVYLKVVIFTKKNCFILRLHVILVGWGNTI